MTRKDGNKSLHFFKAFMRKKSESFPVFQVHEAAMPTLTALTQTARRSLRSLHNHPCIAVMYICLAMGFYTRDMWDRGAFLLFSTVGFILAGPMFVLNLARWLAD